MDELDAANRTLVNLISFFIGVYLVMCLFGCASPPPVEHKPLFSVTPAPTERQLAKRRFLDNALERLHPTGAEPYVSGEPVFVDVIGCTSENVARVRHAVKLAVRLRRPLVVNFDGLGGRVVAGWDIVEALQDPRLPAVRCGIKGEADSMNAFAFVLAPCTSRSLYRDSRLVFHHPSVDLSMLDKAEDVERKSASGEAIAKALCYGVAANSKGRVSPELCHFMLHQNSSRTWSLSGQEAIDAGLADFTLDVGQ